MRGTWQPGPASLVPSFDKIATKYQLGPESYSRSDKLKTWVRKNYKSKYVPEELLKMWGFSIEDFD